jgi:hypothetical protein
VARIRSIKPDFFRHEALYEAERASGLPLRIAFAGLWTAADREGRFAWRPRVLKLDVLPFDDVDFGRVLEALESYGFVVRYTVGADTYGHIPSWHKHQHVNQREAASSIPAPPEPSADTCTHVHAHGEGKGKEGKGNGREGEGEAHADARAGITFGQFERQPEAGLEAWRDVEGVNPQAVAEWCEYAARLDPPKRLNGISRIALAKDLAGIGDPAAQLSRVRASISNGWRNIRDATVNGSGVPRKPSHAQTLAKLRAAADAAGEPEL